VSDRLFAEGARDVWITPVQMKKGRPGVVLSAIVAAADEDKVADLLLRETTTLGVRIHRLAGRHEARREMREVATPFGPVRVKVKWVGTDAVGAAPEYDDCARFAREYTVPARVVYESALAEALRLLNDLARRPG